MLLAYGRRVVFRVQQVNHYSLLPPVALRREMTSAKKSTAKVPASTSANLPVKAPWSGKNRARKMASEPDSGIRDTQEVLQSITIQQSGSRKGKCCGPQQFRFDIGAKTRDDIHSEVDVEQAARQLYDRIRLLNPARSLTKDHARRLIKTYGPVMVERGLGVLARRDNIRNPAGFLLTYLRSESREKLPEKPQVNQVRNREESKKGCGSQQSEWQAKSVVDAGLDALELHHQQWVEKIKNSPYARMYESVFEPA
jgi:hypothetical protein